MIAQEPTRKIHRYWLGLVGVLVFSMLVRVGLIFWLAYTAGVSWRDVLAGHDGVEYLAMAEHFAKGTVAEIPVEARRHDLGWPLLLAFFSRIMPLPFASLTLQLVLTAAVAGLTSLLAMQVFSISPTQSLLPAAAAVLAYPASIYYSCFALSEPFFVTLILSAFLLAHFRRFFLAALLAGLCATVRSPAVLLLPPLAWSCWKTSVELPLRTRLTLCAGVVGFALVPVFTVWAVSHFVWGTYSASLHSPRFSWPFAGFQGLSQRGSARALYVGLCVVIVCFGVLKLALLSRKRPSLSVQALAFFAVLFLVFHLCLESLVYYGQRIYLADYVDRYFLPLWPLVVLATHRWWRTWVVALSFVAALALSVYWGKNYFAQVKAHGAPMLEHLQDVRPQ